MPISLPAPSARPSRRLPSLTALLALLLVFCGAARLTAQELRQQVDAVLAQADQVAPAELYDLSDALADIAPDKNLDGYRTALLAAVGDSQDSKVRLCAALALRQLTNGDLFGKDILELLRPVATAADAELRGAAMWTLGQDKLFNARVLSDVQDIVAKNASDELVDPSVRIQAALALWNVGSNTQRGVAKNVLEQFLKSSDRDLRIRGALALAEINTEGGMAWQILREIRDQPTEAGRQARLFLEREETRRKFLDDLAKLRLRGADSADDGQYAVLDELRRRVHAQHIHGEEVTDPELVEYAAKGMMQGLDPHSTYFTSDEFQRFYFDLNREYGGIGAFVNFDQDGDFSIVRPIYSGPAYEAGLRSGDKILEVDGWETGGHTTEEIIKRLKGKPDTQVVLKFFRPGFQEAQDLSVTRRQISVPAVNWAMIPGQIGYIEMINFSSNISEELQVALSSLMAQGALGIVLDVRNNTGGFLTEARDVVSQFVEGDKLVVYTQGPAEPRQDYRTRRGRRNICVLPLAVLTNRLSASASEITAGALQDLGRATIIGQRTYGKGSVQNIFGLMSSPPEPFEDLNGDRVWQEGEDYTDVNGNGHYDPGAHIKLTVAKYYLPSGRCPHREFDKEGRIVDPNWGVIPDRELDLLENKPEDAWKNAAVFALLKKGVFRDYVKQHIGKNEALFRALAEGDDGDPQRYPDFDAFYAGLETRLGKDDVRRWLRYEVRDQISDLRGAVYPGQRALGDPQEDAQLQEAVRVLMKKDGRDIRDVAAYQHVLKIGFDDEKTAKGAGADK
ncbi:MAG: PDZ domain-containing protein [Planctomycetes bacterium]|nr:PDZ domain-containing protein [Planctomycetota bacterium]